MGSWDSPSSRGRTRPARKWQVADLPTTAGHGLQAPWGRSATCRLLLPRAARRAVGKTAEIVAIKPSDTAFEEISR